MRPSVLLTWIAVAGCATEPGAAPPPSPVRPSADVASSDDPAPPVVAPAEKPPISSRKRVELLELRVANIEQSVRLFVLDHDYAVVAKYSCVFYHDVGRHGEPDDPAERWHVTKDDLDRLSADIDDARAAVAGLSERAAFDTAVTDRFRAVRARIEEMTR